MLPLACGTKLKEVKIVIEFRNVSKVYDSTDTHALNHVNIKIEDGEFVFVVGSSDPYSSAQGTLSAPPDGCCVPGLPPDPQDDGV